MASKFAVFVVTAGLACGAGAALAESVPGNAGSGSLPPAGGNNPDLSTRRIVNRAPDISENGERIAPPDPALIEKGFTTKVRNRDGSEDTVPPGDELKDIIGRQIKGEKGADAAPRTAPDPALVDPGRTIIDGDDRVRIKKTTDYPFRTIGQLWAKHTSGGWGTCSATLIGKRAIITAAHCLYDHDDGGWNETYEFYPGKNGSDEPYGWVNWKTTYILTGFADNYKENYGSVVPWDLGVLILDEPVGDSLGWMGYSAYDPAYPFTANIVGYPGDKDNEMWRASCDVDPNNVDDTNMTYLCDTMPGSSGSSIYDYDPDARDRHINGVNIASTPSRNYGLRLSRAYFAWVKDRVSR